MDAKAIEEKVANDMNVDYQYSISSRTSLRRDNESREIFGKQLNSRLHLSQRNISLNFSKKDLIALKYECLVLW